MPSLILGLDVGSRSVGWALIEPGKQIIAAGVRVFPEGVDRDQQGGEKSKSRARRDARSIRRQLARRARRKQQLTQLLTNAGLLPSDPIQLSTLLTQNPYELRRRALDDAAALRELHEDPLTLHQIGRALVHLNQRRGFLSNRKTDKKREDTKGLLAEISQLAADIDKSGSETLGEYLAGGPRSKNNLHRGVAGENARGRHTRRDMYRKEFDSIWRAQATIHQVVLSDELRKQIERVMFFQRKIYWPKSVVGRCELERKEKRCPRADRGAQRFRILQEVNNLRFLDRVKGQEQHLENDRRESLIDYLSSSKERTFDQIRKKLGFGDWVRFNLEGPDRSKLQGHVTDAMLGSKKCVGKRWHDLPDATKVTIVAILIDEESESVAVQRLIDEGGLSSEEAERAVAVNLPDGYMSYSRLAIERLLPHLERGLPLMGENATNSALHAANYLRPDEREIKQSDYLPPTPDLPNPIVRQALVEVRKVVNGILREHIYRGGHKLGEIHVELAREAKKSFEERFLIRVENATRRRARDAARTAIESYAVNYRQEIKLSRGTIDRYLLWKEQDEFCTYCGKKISQAQLFGGDADLDHILPRWRSLDNSLANKVACHRSCNSGEGGKGDRTPREWLETTDPDRYEMVLRLAERLPYSKQRKFQQKDINLVDFVERQLRDTAYISRCVSQYLRCLGVRVVCPRGQMTAELRHFWGLDKILAETADGKKNRADHRHHAVDAVVIAFTGSSQLKAVAEKRGKNVKPPWSEGFHEAVADSIGKILVSHRAQARLHGKLHEATFYGPTAKPRGDACADEATARPWAGAWIEDPHTFVRRKDLTELTSTGQLEKVRDSTIRAILLEHLRRAGIVADPAKPTKIPANVFAGANTPRMPSGVPIKRVRMLEESQTFRPVSERRNFQFVKPGNNHHIVYRAAQTNGEEQWFAEVVPMWDAAARARRGKPLVNRSNRAGQRFVMALSIGEMFEMDGANGQRILCTVRKLDQRSKRVYYKLHTDAREAKDLDKENLYLTPVNLQKRKARKVTVDPLGRLRPAK